MSTRAVGVLFIVLLGLPWYVWAWSACPNVIIILTDDQGYADVGFNGCEDIPTPHIDSIAANGVRFTNGYVTFPVCGPSRAGLLTGRYQGRFGFTRNPSVSPYNPTIGIPRSEQNIAEILKPAGYRSMIVGKWHMGSHPDHHPLARGFDEFYGFLSGGHRYFPEEIDLEDLTGVREQWQWYRTKLLRNYERVGLEEYLTDALTGEAVRFIHESAQGDTRFFLYLAYNAPHGPLQATERYLERFPAIEDTRRRTYAAMVSAVDDGVGAVLEALSMHDLEEDTFIVFLSDNGGARNNGSRNAPLRGHKETYYEGGIRVPFAMQWKGRLPAGVVYDFPVISLDIVATVVGEAGLESSLRNPLDGVNLIPFLNGGKEGRPHQALFWRNEKTGLTATRVGDLKLIRSGTTKAELYHLPEDIRETRNLAREQAGLLPVLDKATGNWLSHLRGQAFPDLMTDRWWDRHPHSGAPSD